MKRIGRIVTAILVVFVLAVIWYAHSGEAVVARYVFTNAAGVARGTVWVRSDKGLFGGPVTAVASLPSRPAIVYAGTREDETYVSSNGGSVWELLGGSSSGHYVAGIEVAPRANGKVVGKAVYGAGFFLSEDGGQTWKSANRGLHSRSLSCLAAAVGSPEVVFAGTGDAGLYVSHDGGRSWKHTGRALLGDDITCVAVSRDSFSVYAGTLGSGLFGSHDGGETWTSGSAVWLPAVGYGGRPRPGGRSMDRRLSHGRWCGREL